MNKMANTLRFFEMLSTLLKGNTNLIDAVGVLSVGEPGGAVQEAAAKLMSVLKKGGGFSDGLAYAFGGDFVFPDMYRGIIRSSEQTGNIEAAVSHIVGDLERKIRARETISAAVLYPAVIAVIALAGTIVLITRGIPFFSESGMLPGVFLGQAVRSVLLAGMFLLGSGVLLTVLCYRLFVMDCYEFRIFYELHFLLAGGIPLAGAVTQCIMSIGENRWGRALVYVKKEIISGGRIGGAFEKAGVFSGYITGWLTVGDRNGEVTTVCERIAGYYRRQDGGGRLCCGVPNRYLFC